MEAREDEVALWEEDVVIPTYPVGEPDHNPMFLEKRVYQGSSGAVYPFPVIDSVSESREDRHYRALFIENEHLKVMVLPELGGRIHMAYAKGLDYHFVYYNRVIKPALVGLAGPWICGGIEFNWPQHHRPSTFSPVDYLLERQGDGTATVWLGEIDRMQRTKATVGVSLLPGKAYIRVEGRLFNRTALPQTFLWWANPAVAVNEHYQSVFPPDVHAVFDHGKRDLSRFPIATGSYYKIDYSSGVDISWWKNIPVPTSYMAYHSDYDFVGGYDHGRGAGILHVADHHLSPGKKLWTWGAGDFGRVWERNLTDEDGPYIELMTGVFTDNQPDFSWLESGEEKRFEQYFLPYAGIGRAKNATRDVAISLEAEEAPRLSAAGRVARIGVASTSRRTFVVELARAITGLDHGEPVEERRSGADTDGAEGSAVAGVESAFADRTMSPEPPLLAVTVEIDPSHPYRAEVPLGPEARTDELRLSVRSIDGRVRLSYREGERPGLPIPQAAKAAPPPQEVRTAEELCLIGLHLEQYRHATFDPAAYYAEALKRDPGDSRANEAMGLYLLRRGLLRESENHLRRAIERLTTRNPNPANGAPFYFLGVALELSGRYEEAREAYFKASWNGALQGAAVGSLARIAARSGDLETALSHAERSIAVNGLDRPVRVLRAALLRRLGRRQEAREELDEVLREDPLEMTARNELRLLGGGVAEGASEQASASPADAKRRPVPPAVALSEGGIEVAFDYLRFGLFEEAVAWIDRLTSSTGGDPSVGGAGAMMPLAHYLRAYFLDELGRPEQAVAAARLADALPAGTCFPNQLEAIAVLERACLLHPTGAKASYYLGNLWYNNRCAERAIESWERSAALDAGFPTVHRNIALAAFNKLRDPARAGRELALAFSLDPTDARVLFELDQLARITAVDPAERLPRLERHRDLVERRDDLALERIALLNLLGRHDEALEALSGRRFHPWEGGEGKVSRQWVAALLGLARRELFAKRASAAIELAKRALAYPENLGEGKLEGALDNDVHYWLGRGYRALGSEKEAIEAFSRAAVGDREPTISLYYNDQPADLIFYQGLALASLGRADAARGRFHRLLDYGERHRSDAVTVDYFAVSLPDFLVFEGDLTKRNEIFCDYLRGLGELGLASVNRRDTGRARSILRSVTAAEPSHLGARELLQDLDRGWSFV